tara:strand:+ start:85 stop:243 length:159 start_codon:yes stop_codon:yes gene_type:complete
MLNKQDTVTISRECAEQIALFLLSTLQYNPEAELSDEYYQLKDAIEEADYGE